MVVFTSLGCKNQQCDLPPEKRTVKKLIKPHAFWDDFEFEEPTQPMFALPQGIIAKALSTCKCGGHLDPYVPPITMPSGHTYTHSCATCGNVYPRPPKPTAWIP